MNEKLSEYFEAGKKNLFIIYILYVAALIAGHPLLSIVGVVMVYINRDSANEVDYTHYLFLWNTFWLAMWIYLLFLITMLIPFVGIIINLLFHIWYVVRIVFGINFLLKNKAYPNPNTWLFI